MGPEQEKGEVNKADSERIHNSRLTTHSQSELAEYSGANLRDAFAKNAEEFDGLMVEMLSLNTKLQQNLDDERAANRGYVDALEAAREAIGSLPIDVLGEGSDGTGLVWPIRDELTDNITQALNNPNTKQYQLEREVIDSVVRNRGTLAEIRLRVNPMWHSTIDAITRAVAKLESFNKTKGEG